MSAAGHLTKTFWTPLAQKKVLIAGDPPNTHRQYERLAMRTFYVPGATTPTALTDVMNLLRNLFDIRFITPNAASSTLVVRPPQNLLDAATQFLETLHTTLPQPTLHTHVSHHTHTLTPNIAPH